MKGLEPKERIIFALDVSEPERAIFLVRELKPLVGCFKIGLEFISAMLASLVSVGDNKIAEANLLNVRELFSLLDGNIFWDGKFDDIPNTIGGASKQVSRMGVKMFNLHASAGLEAIAKAVENKGESLVLGVTVLTSIGEKECKLIFGAEPNTKVITFAEMLKDKRADGIICSPQELELLRADSRFDGLLTVSPGVRPKWVQKGDQKRVMTPADAVKAGADYLVIGRPIRQSPEEIGTPADAARKIAEEIASVS